MVHAWQSAREWDAFRKVVTYGYGRLLDDKVQRPINVDKAQRRINLDHQPIDLDRQQPSTKRRVCALM